MLVDQRWPPFTVWIGFGRQNYLSMVKTLPASPPKTQLCCIGLSYVPEDRFNDGLFRIRDVAENTTGCSACRILP